MTLPLRFLVPDHVLTDTEGFLRVGATASVGRDIGGETGVRVNRGRETGVPDLAAARVRTYSVAIVGAEVGPLQLALVLGLHACTPPNWGWGRRWW